MVQAAGQTMMDPWGRCSWASRLFFSSPEDSAGTQRPCVDSNDLTFPIACWQNLQCAHQSWPEIDSIQRWFATSFFWVTLYKPSKLMSQQKSHSVPWWEEDGGVEGCACIVSCENSKKKITAEQPSTGECWIPPNKDTPHPRAKEKPQQDGRRGKITFRIKPHIHQRHLEGSNKPCAHQDPETPQRLSQNCV